MDITIAVIDGSCNIIIKGDRDEITGRVATDGC